MTIFKRSIPFVLVALLAALVLASIGIAGRDGGAPSGFDAPQVDAVPPEIRELMAAFDGTRSGPDSIPDGLAAKLDQHAEFGMNPGLSRLAIGNATSAVYLVPAASHVCAVLTLDGGGNVMCPSVDDIANGKAGPTTVGLGERGVAIYGLVPDGVQSVAVLTGAAAAMNVNVESNGYYTVVPRGVELRAVSYESPTGTVEFDIVDPSKVLEQQ